MTTPTQRPRPFLRVYADMAAPLVEEIQGHRSELELARQEADPESILAIVGPLSEAYRRLARLDEAVKYAEEAMALARELERPKALIANGIRLGTALQYRNEQPKAAEVFTETVALAREHGHLLDYALQHFGKCLVELGQVDEAIARFDEALVIRKERGDTDMVDSTEEALEGARKRRQGI